MDLKGKIGGLPKWAWALILAGGVIGGYMLYRHTKTGEGEEAPPENAVNPETAPGATSGLRQYEGTEAAGGLQALGLPGPIPVGTTPVASPYVPEQFPQVLGGQGETITGLANDIIARDEAGREAQAPPVTNVNIRSGMGNHHKRPVNHKPTHREEQKKRRKK